MKKLMIAFAAVSMAVIANAASATWGVSSWDDIVDQNGSLYTGTMTLACESLGFSQGVSVENGYFEINDVAIDCTFDSNYAFTLTGSATDALGTWSYSASGDGYVDGNGNGLAGIAAGTWAFTPSPVPTPTPEPTSGLLLLLGVAGLALRRKQK